MEFLVSLYGTASLAHQQIFYTIPRAGHLIAGSEHRIRRDHFPGHELILCLKGSGSVLVMGQAHAVTAGDFVWVNCHHPHEHGGSAQQPWEVVWVRIEGPALDQICRILSVSDRPVFPSFDLSLAKPIYNRIFDLMSGDCPLAPARLHVEVAQLLSLAFCSRQEAESQTIHIPSILRRTIEHLKLFFFEQHRVDDLAAMAGLSTSHFSRLFKSSFGTSPIDWLRRERVNQAKRRLTESRDAIEEIATQVGYRDRFFFSRDFKKLTGYSPREFRRREASQS